MKGDVSERLTKRIEELGENEIETIVLSTKLLYRRTKSGE